LPVTKKITPVKKGGLQTAVVYDSFNKTFYQQPKQHVFMNNKKQLLLLVLCSVFARLTMAQARLVVNGGIVNITNGASLVIDNPDNAAIIYNGTGYIRSEGITNKVIWSVGAGNGNTFLVPFGNPSNYLPLQFNAASGTGTSGQMILSTYKTLTFKNSDFLPPGVTNVNRNGTDNSAKIIDRFWQINAQGYVTKPTLSNLVFSYADAEFSIPNAITEASLAPQRWNSNLLKWDDYFPPSSVNTTTNKVSVPSVPGNQLFDWWTLADASAPLPVTLVYFKATVVNNTVAANWQTTAEINSSYFEVWRSADLQNFEAVGKVAAAGNSAVTLNYAFTDASPYSGFSYYRLKSVDLDGNFTWSPAVKVTISNQAFVSVYPNPAAGYINLLVSNAMAAAKPTAFIYDAKGSLVTSFRIAATLQQVNTSRLPAGLYSIRFIYNNQFQSISFIKK
jgi:Secretion system C-terminal sorting domain